jgi:hypothetical protein
MSPQVYEERLTLACHELLRSSPGEFEVQTLLEAHLGTATCTGLTAVLGKPVNVLGGATPSCFRVDASASASTLHAPAPANAFLDGCGLSRQSGGQKSDFPGERKTPASPQDRLTGAGSTSRRTPACQTRTEALSRNASDSVHRSS